MAEEFLGDGIFNKEDGNEGVLGRDEGLLTEEEGTVKGWKGGSKRICDLSREVLELKSRDTTTLVVYSWNLSGRLV